MPQRVKLIENEKHGQLTILKFSHHITQPNGKKKAYVLCCCDCGNEKVIGLADVRSGSTSTCGDYTRHSRKPRVLKQTPDSLHLGEVFGKLTVKEFLGYSSTPKGARVPKMRCTCECGNEIEVSLWDLKTGKTKTCGFNHPHYEDRTIPAFNNYYRFTYRGAAAKRGLTFELTEEQFRQITSQDCYYCGSAPTPRSVKTGTLTSTCIVNGIDRVDNSLGYVLGNVVPCCFDCNHAKATLSQARFIELAHLVAARHPKI